MSLLSRARESLGRKLAIYLSKPIVENIRPTTCQPECLAASLRIGDILLVEGVSRFSTAIKYITQSTWSHATLCVSKEAGRELLEADVLEGVRLVPLSDYWKLHTRICRPVGLNDIEIDAIVQHAMGQIGHQYDLKNILDLARYLIQTPPVPVKMRRSLLAIGSGDPTKAICSSMIAQSFQSVRYPILPEVVTETENIKAQRTIQKEYFDIRHHSLFAPRDFDISPYFQIIKPTLESGFDPHQFSWASEPTNQEN